jgi:hypothetical protein
MTALGLLAPAAQAQDRLRRFQSLMILHSDGSMSVTETVRVRTDGAASQGLARTLPVQYVSPRGTRYSVAYHVFDGTADGAAKHFRVERHRRSDRVFLTEPGAPLPAGEHIFSFTYLTNRQLGFLNDHDELFWNVTGHNWPYAIEEAMVELQLPATVPPEKLRVAAFTGVTGGTQSDVRRRVDEDGTIRIRTTRVLERGEGLTILIGWPKGLVRQPTPPEIALNFVKDNRATAIFLIGLVSVVLWYLIAWFFVGQRPVNAEAAPLFHAPKHLSAAAARFIRELACDSRVVVAGVLGLAVKGALSVERRDNGFVFRRGAAAPDGFTAAERGFFYHLFPSPQAGVFTLSADNAERARQAVHALRDRLASAYDRAFFQSNRGVFGVGVAMSVIAALVAIAGLPPDDRLPALIWFFWLAVWTIGLAALLLHHASDWRARAVGAWEAKRRRAWIVLLLLPFLAVSGYVLVLFGRLASLPAAALLFLMLMATPVFSHLLKAPSLLGRRVLDQIDGLGHYLASAETERYTHLYPPHETAESFEALLPFAVALEAEDAWALHFARLLKNADASAAIKWYVGEKPGAEELPGAVARLCDSLRATVDRMDGLLAPGGPPAAQERRRLRNAFIRLVRGK